MRALAFSLLAIFAAAFAPPASAAPFAVQLGDARIGLDAPPGFSDTAFTGSPRIQELAESLTSASNRILLFAITDADLRRFMSGDTPEFRRYMIVVTPKGLEHEHVSQAAFAAYVNESLRELGPLPGDQAYTRYLASRPRGRATLLAELVKEPDTVSVLQGARLSEPVRDEPPKYVFSTTTLLLVRGKALNLSVYTGFDNESDLEWIRAQTTRWIEEVRRLNRVR